MVTARAANRDRPLHAPDLSTSVSTIVSSGHRPSRAANDNPDPDRAARIMIAIGQACAIVVSVSGILAVALLLGR